MGRPAGGDLGGHGPVPAQDAGSAVPGREVILVITYVVVVFSILVQG